MEVIKIKKDSIGKDEKDKLKVAAYIRVSTNHDDQINSFESQKKYYENKINSNNSWILVNIYGDYGISGTKVEKREAFKEMIQEAMAGKIDLILTKSISRFSRNTMDTLKYSRLLKEKNVGIIFEEENINTLTGAGEFLFTVLSSVAQQEIENMSAHIKKAQEMLLKNGTLIFSDGCYGYKFDNKNNKIDIVPKEAKVVKEIYKMFLDGFGYNKIVRVLYNKGIKSPHNKEKWNYNVIKDILTNDKYVGDLLQRKTCRLSPFSKPVVNDGLIDKFLIKDFHEPIISREDFAKVQKMVKAKERHLKKRTKTILQQRIRCGICGSNCYTISVFRDDVVKGCSQRLKHGKKICPDSRDINYEQLLNIIKKGLDKSRKEIINSENENLLYVKNIFRNTKKEINEKAFEDIIKFVFVGDYDYYGRVQPYSLRIVLYNNYPMDDNQNILITDEEVKKTKTEVIYECWVSQNITIYNKDSTGSFDNRLISKVKTKIEVECNTENYTLV